MTKLILISVGAVILFVPYFIIMWRHKSNNLFSNILIFTGWKKVEGISRIEKIIIIISAVVAAIMVAIAIDN